MKVMNNGPVDILIAVAHPSEEEAVRRASLSAACRCEVIVTGVGGAAMSWALQKRFSLALLPRSQSSGKDSAVHTPYSDGGHTAYSDTGHTPYSDSGHIAYSGAGKPHPVSLPSVVIGAGIAGSYVDSLTPGTVVTTLSDCFADMGVDDNGHFIPLFGAGLSDPDAPPFTGGRIHCRGSFFDLASGLMPAVRGATVNMASGSQTVIDRIRKVWDPEIETMEGAWLAYTCAMSGIPWISVRAVSNMVEPRNLKNWNIPLALQNLQEKMTHLLELFPGPAGR